MKKVIFIDTTHPSLPGMLEANGFEVFHYYETDAERLKAMLPEFHGVILRSKFKFGREMTDAGNQLEFIGRVGAGMENIDVEYAQARGIRLFNAPEGNRDAVGEHALGMLLASPSRLSTV